MLVSTRLALLALREARHGLAWGRQRTGGGAGGWPSKGAVGARPTSGGIRRG